MNAHRSANRPTKILLPVVDDAGVVEVANYIVSKWSLATGPVEVTILIVTNDRSEFQSDLVAEADLGRAAKIGAVVSRHLRCADFDHVTRHIIGDPAEAIAQYARDEGADMIVASKPSRSSISRTMLLIAHVSGASALDRLIELAPCPVLVVVPNVNDQETARVNAMSTH
jgi:nucleotide-binding universal stress UspA family protein